MDGWRRDGSWGWRIRRRMPRGNNEQKLESCGGMRAGRAKYREGE